MDLRDELQRGLDATDVKSFTPMQREAICNLKRGHDVIVQSTFGYSEHIILSTSVLQKVNDSVNAIQAVVLSPNDEIGREVRHFINGLGQFMKILCHVISSKTDWKGDMKVLQSGCHILISTPDRFLRLTREKINLKNVEIFVLCEYNQQNSHLYEQISGKFNKATRRLYFVENVQQLPAKMLDYSMKIISSNQSATQTLQEFLNDFKVYDAKRKFSFEMEDVQPKFIAIDSNIPSCSTVTDGSEIVCNPLPISHHSRSNYRYKSKEMSAGYCKDPKSGLPLWTRTNETFESMGISRSLLRGIHALGFNTPTTIQQKSICAILSENEVVIESVTSCGKTVSFVIALIEKLKPLKYKNQALVIVDTVKAAAATLKLFSKLTRFSRIRAVDCGNAKDSRGMSRFSRSFDRRTNVVIGDPFQIHHLVFVKDIDLRRVVTIVVDDADKLFAEGNFDQLFNIFKVLPARVQRVFLCRTMVNEVSSCIRKLSSKLVKVVMESHMDITRFTHYYVNVNCKELKLTTLCKLYDVIEAKKALIYCNSESAAVELKGLLRLNGFQIIEIATRMSTVTKEVDLNAEKNAVVVSDGYNIDSDIDFELIINYEIPQLFEIYKDRLERQHSNVNVVISLVSGNEIYSLARIKNGYNVNIQEMKIDTAKSTLMNLKSVF